MSNIEAFILKTPPLRRKIELVLAIDLFKTDLFQDCPNIQRLCEEVGTVFVTDDTSWGHHGHFTTFFGVIVKRDGYKDPIFHDLYVLHELWHRKTLIYKPGRSWLEWSRDLIRSELQSSLVSECHVYGWMPELRKKTFSHEIWVDRFLREGRMSINLLREERIRAMNAPQVDDFLEHQICNYSHQNMLWCRVWASSVGVGPDEATCNKAAFRVVDDHMSREDWRNDHVAWLTANSFRQNLPLNFPVPIPLPVPFPLQAQAFKPIYERSIQEFGNDVLSR